MAVTESEHSPGTTAVRSAYNADYVRMRVRREPHGLAYRSSLYARVRQSAAKLRSPRRSAVCRMGTVHDLAERPVTFDHGYNMSCPDCPGITTLTAAEYYSEPNEAHVQCAHCGADIHFGPAVMALRDPSDPVLDDQRACRVAWYHTGTDPPGPAALT
jgi:hypothetical protein